MFGLPVDEPWPLKHDRLSDERLEQVGQRPRPRNRLGFALQVCPLRYPGRALLPDEVIPVEIANFLGAQVGLRDADLSIHAAREKAHYKAAREKAHYKHIASLRQLYGFKTFPGRGTRDLKLCLNGQAEHAVYKEEIARGPSGQGRRAAPACETPGPPDLAAHTSPRAWAHILLTGEFKWSKREKPQPTFAAPRSNLHYAGLFRPSLHVHHCLIW